ncbi:MAG: LytR C-terminal domain-containing protein [Acidobacteria bacterium]|nr:LytR C-terminal domain-containing protein [Acidobacteriota bacterium]
MSNDNVGRSPRTTNNNAPVGSTVAIVVTAIAVVLGFLILRKVNDSGSSSAATTLPEAATTLVVPTSAIVTTTTIETLQTKGTKVQVANASNASGVAKQMTTALSGKGFDMATATNSTVNPKLDISKVVYNPADPNAVAVANAVAKVMGGLTVEPAAGAPPVESGAFAEGSGVIVLLGNDLAGKTLPEINGAATTGTTAPPTTPLPTAAPASTLAP